MESKILLFCGWMLTITIVSATWLSRPGHIQHCVGDTVNFNWAYDETTSVHVSMIFWTFIGTSQTMMGWYDNRNPKIYNGYFGRVYLLEGANAGIVLDNVTEADSGEYQIEMSGPGHVDQANLHVYGMSDLVPTLSIEGQLVDFDHHDVNVTGLEPIMLLLNTGSLLSANISMQIKGFPDKICLHATTCTTTVDRPEDMDDTTPVTVLVDYDICPGQHHMYTSNMALSVSNIDKGVPWKRSVTIGIICTILIIVVGVVFLTLWILRRKNKRKTKSHSTHKYIEAPPIEVDSKSIQSAFDNISISDLDHLRNDDENQGSIKGPSVTMTNNKEPHLPSPEPERHEHTSPPKKQNTRNIVNKDKYNNAKIEFFNPNAGIPFDIHA